MRLDFQLTLTSVSVVVCLIVVVTTVVEDPVPSVYVRVVSEVFVSVAYGDVVMPDSIGALLPVPMGAVPIGPGTLPVPMGLLHSLRMG